MSNLQQIPPGLRAPGGAEEMPGEPEQRTVAVPEAQLAQLMQAAQQGVAAMKRLQELQQPRLCAQCLSLYNAEIESKVNRPCQAVGILAGTPEWQQRIIELTGSGELPSPQISMTTFQGTELCSGHMPAGRPSALIQGTIGLDLSKIPRVA